MKKNAIIIAGILAAAGAAQAQQDSSDRYRSSSPSQYDQATSTSSETVERDSTQGVVPPATSDSSALNENWESAGSSSGSVSASVSGENYEADADEEFRVDDSERDTDFEAEYSSGADSDISADSSKRGGSLDARGYDQDANNDEIEGAPDPINPGKQADSSIRGGSIFAREREWNHDAEPSSGRLDHKRHMKADSSIRGGSIEARGGREAMRQMRDRGEYEYRSSNAYSYDLDSTRDDFGQGSSATWESDTGQGSLQGSANWNPDDDLLRDGMDAEAQSTIEYERNNDASVGGAVSGESGSFSSTLDDVELQLDSSGKEDLNSSEQLEENISGEFQLDDDGESRSREFHSDLSKGTADPNSLDSIGSSINSSRSTDLVHDETDIEISAESSDLSSDMEREQLEATGAAATSESGSESSSDVDDNEESSSPESFESNDPALRSSDSPLSDNDLNFIYRDNRAHGVGSLATGEFGVAASGEVGSSSMSDQELASEVKGRLTRESSGAHSLGRSDVARNIQVSADNGEITLSGTVPSEKEKQMIEVRAAEMPGVQRVNNQLTVTAQADPEYRNLNRGHDLEDRTSDLQD